MASDWPITGERLAMAPQDNLVPGLGLMLSVPLFKPGPMTRPRFLSMLAVRLAWMAKREGYDHEAMAREAADALEVAASDLLPFQDYSPEHGRKRVAAELVGILEGREVLCQVILPEQVLKSDPAATEAIEGATLQTWLARVAFPAN
ncbi:MAG: hypothetical protein NTW19_01525 [Planctomycetota bacterium]|nr:hypothetical protein [Planctomycetota bacterium]